MTYLLSTTVLLLEQVLKVIDDFIICYYFYSLQCHVQKIMVKLVSFESKTQSEGYYSTVATVQ
jgi:hypothetical protein